MKPAKKQKSISLGQLKQLIMEGFGPEAIVSDEDKVLTASTLNHDTEGFLVLARHPNTARFKDRLILIGTSSRDRFSIENAGDGWGAETQYHLFKTEARAKEAFDEWIGQWPYDTNKELLPAEECFVKVLRVRCSTSVEVLN